MSLKNNIAEEILSQTSISKRDIAGSADIMARIMGGVQGIASYGAIYMCGRNVCHITTGNEAMSIVRDGKMISACCCGNICHSGYIGKQYYYTFRLKNNDTVFLHERGIFDSYVQGYICSLVSLNLKRRFAKRAYKSNAEVLDEVCRMLKFKYDRHIDSVLTVITCVADI